MSEKLTDDQIAAKAAELSELHKVKVFPIVFMDPATGDQIVGYVKEANRVTKLRVMDKGMTLGAPYSAASEMLEANLLKEVSDPRIYSEKSEDDFIYIGAVDACYNTIRVAVDQYKKK